MPAELAIERRANEVERPDADVLLALRVLGVPRPVVAHEAEGEEGHDERQQKARRLDLRTDGQMIHPPRPRERHPARERVGREDDVGVGEQ